MREVPPSRGKQFTEPRDLRTSELLRRAASELTSELAGRSAEQPGGPYRGALARELLLRALWIERARADAGLSDERRRGIAAIEDVDQPDPESVGRSARLRCSTVERCDFHTDGGPVDEPCPGQCNAPGCTLDGHYEVGTDRVVCVVHGAIVLFARAVSEALAADNAEG